jgi:hypothetical protein
LRASAGVRCAATNRRFPTRNDASWRVLERYYVGGTQGRAAGQTGYHRSAGSSSQGRRAPRRATPRSTCTIAR